MKKVISIFLCVALCFICSSCGVEGGNPSVTSNSPDVSNSENATAKLLFEQDNVKISYSGISPDVGIGEGIYLLVENSRTESIIVNIAEVSLNDTMQAVIQPQMPLHLTSPNKQSKQPFVFTNVKDLNGKAQFKIKVLNENFEEIFVSDFVEVSF